MTTQQTGKRRGPVPRPKGQVAAYVYEASEAKHKEGEIWGIFKIEIKANVYASTDDFRKAAKKAIDKHFNEMK